MVNNNNTKHHPQEWELRQPTARSRGNRVEEIFSEDGDEDFLNGYNPNTFAARQRALTGEELYHNGYDVGYDRYGHYDDYYSDEDAELVRSALDRASRAKAKGKTNITLTTDEMDALERRNMVQQHDAPAHLASPPSTPKAKTKLSGRSGSLSSIVGGKTRKKSSSPATPKTTPKSNSKAKMTRKLSTDAVPILQPGQPVLVQGPDGPMYAPLAYYPQDYARPPMPRSRSRSASQSSRRETTPPDQYYPPNAYSPRYYPPPAGMRPSSASSTRSFAEDADRYQMPRNRSGSNMQYRYNEDVAASMPAVHGRRNVSGPPDVSYATLRRVPPASSPLAARPAPPAHSHSDPSVNGRRMKDASPSSSDDDQGVQVDIVPEASGTGYSINRTQVKDSDSKRRKARK